MVATASHSRRRRGVDQLRRRLGCGAVALAGRGADQRPLRPPGQDQLLQVGLLQQLGRVLAQIAGAETEQSQLLLVQLGPAGLLQPVQHLVAAPPGGAQVDIEEDRHPGMGGQLPQGAAGCFPPQGQAAVIEDAVGERGEALAGNEDIGAVGEDLVMRLPIDDPLLHLSRRVVPIDLDCGGHHPPARHRLQKLLPQEVVTHRRDHLAAGIAEALPQKLDAVRFGGVAGEHIEQTDAVRLIDAPDQTGVQSLFRSVLWGSVPSTKGWGKSAADKATGTVGADTSKKASRIGRPFCLCQVCSLVAPLV